MMSDLFDFIYEKKDKLNLLSGSWYGDYIFVHKHYRELSKCIYYDHIMLYDVLYIYSGGDNCGDKNGVDSCSDGSIDNIKVSKIKYNGIICHFYKRNNVDEIWLEYMKMCNGRKYSFIIYPNHTVYSLINKYEWNVLIKYFVKYDIIKIWINLRNGCSRVDSCDTYV